MEINQSLVILKFPEELADEVSKLLKMSDLIRNKPEKDEFTMKPFQDQKLKVKLKIQTN